MKYIPQLMPAPGFAVLAGTKRSQAATLVLEPQETTGGPDNEHPASDQWLYVLDGEGRAVIGSEVLELGPGSLLLIEAGETHEINNTGDHSLDMLNFYAPPAY
jgi:mannose-6-phosphate isomerase-like protein (cupin superfamily)